MSTRARPERADEIEVEAVDAEVQVDAERRHPAHVEVE
jgi:hypothetical protein